MESKTNKISFIVYQYIVLLALVGLLAWKFFHDGEIQMLILGVLVGRMHGIPLPEKWSHEGAWSYPQYPLREVVYYDEDGVEVKFDENGKRI